MEIQDLSPSAPAGRRRPVAKREASAGDWPAAFDIVDVKGRDFHLNQMTEIGEVTLIAAKHTDPKGQKRSGSAAASYATGVMPDDNSKTLQLLNILEDPKGAGARKKYLELFDLDEINDQAVYELIEDLVIEATLLKEPVIEIRTDLAQQILIMLKQGIKRPRGGQQSTRYQKLRKRTLVDLGRRIKAQLVAGGMNATEAHHQASEEAAAEGERYGLDYKAGYLAREMD